MSISHNGLLGLISAFAAFVGGEKGRKVLASAILLNEPPASLPPRAAHQMDYEESTTVKMLSTFREIFWKQQSKSTQLVPM